MLRFKTTCCGVEYTVAFQRKVVDLPRLGTREVTRCCILQGSGGKFTCVIGTAVKRPGERWPRWRGRRIALVRAWAKLFYAVPEKSPEGSVVFGDLMEKLGDAELGRDPGDLRRIARRIFWSVPELNALLACPLVKDLDACWSPLG